MKLWEIVFEFHHRPSAMTYQGGAVASSAAWAAVSAMKTASHAAYRGARLVPATSALLGATTY